jgi:hypothetical protein
MGMIVFDDAGIRERRAGGRCQIVADMGTCHLLEPAPPDPNGKEPDCDHPTLASCQTPAPAQPLSSTRKKTNAPALNPAMSVCRPDAVFSRHRRLLRTMLAYVAVAVALAA